MIPENTTLAEIVLKFPPAATLFEKFDLDYCCRGNVSLREACPDDDRYHKVEHALHRMLETDSANSGPSHYESFDLKRLIEHIVVRHHAYVKSAMPAISGHLQKAVMRHGSHHPELATMLQLFTEVQEELELHMMREEQVLFPKIIEMAGAASPEPALSGSMLAAPIRRMMFEHEHAGSKMYQIRELIRQYRNPEEACTTVRLCFEELRQFELDLHQHVHLENNILFPRALALFGAPDSEPLMPS